MKVIIRINNFGTTLEDRRALQAHLVEDLNSCGVAVVPSYCDIFVIEHDRKESPSVLDNQED